MDLNLLCSFLSSVEQIDAMEKVNGRAIALDKQIDMSKHALVKTMELVRTGMRQGHCSRGNMC